VKSFYGVLIIRLRYSIAKAQTACKLDKLNGEIFVSCTVAILLILVHIVVRIQMFVSQFNVVTLRQQILASVNNAN